MNDANIPWKDRYPAAVAIALLGLCPYLVLATASTGLTRVLTKDLHASAASLQLADGLANAGYAVGAVVAAYLGQKLLQRHLFLAYEGLFVLGTALACTAASGWQFEAGRVVQGTATGLMLVAALPPLVTRFGVGKLPLTVAIVNVGLFGATTLGPIVGALAGSRAGAVAGWRLLLGAALLLGLLGLAVAQRGYAPFDPPNPDLRLEPSVLPLAVAATVLPFAGTSSLARVGFASPVFLVPFLVGLVALGALVVTQYRAADPLMPVQQLSTQLPVSGTLVAMIAGAVFVALLELVQTYLTRVASDASATPYATLPVGLVVAAVLFGLLLRTRFVPVLVNVGFAALIAAAVVLLGLTPTGATGRVLVAGGLLGFGAGATVSPGLFLAAFGVPSTSLARAFALVELLRSEAAFAVAPAVLALARHHHDLAAGVHEGVVIMLVLAVAGGAVALVLPLLSGARLRVPDLSAWLEDGDKALPSPLVASMVRSVADPEREQMRRH